MGFGIGAGPAGASQHHSRRYVYDVRSGIILGTFHFVGAAKHSTDELHRQLSRQVHESSAVAEEHLAVLSEAELPPGEGPLRVEVTTKQLVRSAHRAASRIRA
jgi:hypothetical protein